MGCAWMVAGQRTVVVDLASRAGSAIIPRGQDRNMAKTPIEIGQSFHKTDSLRIVWTVDSFNETTEPVHVRLTRADDPTTYITVSINVLSDPRHFRRAATDI